jgi:SagB-type dehydrogenase family enzyme
MLLDPAQRHVFKQEERRLRSLTGSFPPVQLPTRALGSVETPSATRERRSHRTFSGDPVAFDDFAALLECLAARRVDGHPKHLYGSAGGLYPVQAYVHVRPRQVANLAAGTYYYHPVDHCLLPLTLDVDLDRAVHAVINRPVFDQASFSIFLVAQMSAIAPVYAERARDFALIEAGLITQLLEESAAHHHIGLCQIGLVDFDAIRDLFLLEESHLFLHALLGGRTALALDAWEEGTL